MCLPLNELTDIPALDSDSGLILHFVSLPRYERADCKQYHLPPYFTELRLSRSPYYFLRELICGGFNDALESHN